MRRLGTPQPVTDAAALPEGGQIPSYDAEIGALYASSGIGVGLISRDMTFLRVNRALAEINGTPVEAHVGRKVAEVLPDLADAAADLMGRLVATRKPIGPVDVTGATPAKPGIERVWSETWTPVFDASGEFVAASVIIIEVTEARRAEKALSDRADEVRRILDGVIAFVGRLDPDGTLTEANRQAIEEGGLRREDVIGRPFWDCYWWSFSEASQTRLKSAIARAAAGEPQRYDVEVRMVGGSRMFIDFQLMPQRDAEGRVVEIIPSAVDITDRKRAEEALRASLGRLRTILSSAQVGIVIAHADGRVTEANRAFLDMLGRTAEDLRLGAIDWRDHLSLPLGHWRRLVTHGTLGPLEITLRRADGREIPTLSSAGLIDGGSRELVGFFIDRTRQKADEEHRELLLLELKHRVKNMLATVQAIAKQTARHHVDRDAFNEALTGRLRAMARAHDLITARNTGEVCLRDLILAQVEPCVSETGQLDYDGPHMQIRPEAANALGLVLHELATNAAKYGALGTETGRVTIRWQGDGPGRVRIDWTEAGGPRVSPPVRRGFGTTLIESSLSHGLGGEIALDYRPGGLHAVMALPAKALDV